MENFPFLLLMMMMMMILGNMAHNRQQTPWDPDTKLNLYKESRDGTLKTTNWLLDSEIQAGQIMLKKGFAHEDELQDPAIRGEMLLPAVDYWVCIRTLGWQTGIVKVFDSLCRKPTLILLDYACRMVVCPEYTVTFLNERVRRQLGSSDCGLFVLAFATDLCHGLDPFRCPLVWNQGE